MEGIYTGPFQLKDTTRRQTLVTVQRLLQSVINRVASNQADKAKKIDDAKDAVIGTLNRVWDDLRIPKMDLPSKLPEEDVPALLEELQP